MFKQFITLSAILISSTAVFAINPIDSIGVENINGKKVIIHKVDPKESYFSISRKYHINVKDIQDYNKNIALQIGTIIKIPTNIVFDDKVLKNNEISAKSFDYKVIAKDNLNLIAEKFATTVEEIKALNQLSNNNLQIGQTLKIPFNKTSSKIKNESTLQKVENISKPVENISKSNDNSTTIEHIVQAKEYLNLIAKKYNTTAEKIKELNQLQSNNLHIGQVLKIRTVNEEKIIEKNVEDKKNTNTIQNSTTIIKTEPSFEHTVGAGETIYSIAHKYKLTTFQLKNLNNLSSNDLTVGQKLTIKGIKPLEENIIQDTVERDSIETLKNPNLRRAAEAYGLNKVDEKGTGVWITDPDLDSTKMLVLHRTASVGTIIQITNPMTNRSTFAKVVGKFTENEATKDAIIVMTKAVANAIGALDKRFLCNISYGTRE